MKSSVVTDHRRNWRNCMYVYPVVSRRSKGLSIGINLNPDKRCNYSCVYCQVDRSQHRRLTQVHLDILHDELHLALEEATSGRLWQESRFASTPLEMRRINDIAFSGDGEPTCLPEFDKAVASAADALAEFPDVKARLLVITNATNLESPQFQRALPVLQANNGEIWVKLDAGTQEYFEQVNRPGQGITLDKIVTGISSVAKQMPVVVQSLFFKLKDTPPSPQEIRAYCQRIRDIRDAGGQIRLIQIHTIARPPQESYVEGLADPKLDALAEVVRTALPGMAVETYYGQKVLPQQQDK